MTLTTHMVIAAAVTKKIAAHHPVVGFFAAVASHYLADAIPHWDYPIRATIHDGNKEKRRWGDDRALLRRDIGYCALDALLGAAIVLLLIRPSSAAQWLGAIGAIVGGALPDFLQGLYLSGCALLKPLQKFHDSMHTKIKLGRYPALGIPFQLGILLTAAFFI